MRTILFIIQKEFTQIFRNRTMLPIIFILPIVQLIILVNAATMEIKNCKMVVVDHDLSTTSGQLIAKFEASPFFIVTRHSSSLKDAERGIKENKETVIFHFPGGFERKLVRENKAEMQILINAIDGMTAGVTQAYIANILGDYNKEIVVKWMGKQTGVGVGKRIQIIPSYWYNPQLNYKIFMVPAVLVLLVTIIGMFLTALNLVREKEMGTIEQINVTPIKKYQFIIGKLVPFWCIAFIELIIGLIIGLLLFKIPIVGSVPLLLLVCTIYLIMVLGMGLFLSTLVDTQQQAMFISFFFMIVFVMMSGIFTSVESMPDWAQVVNKINPIAYFMKLIRMILLKGSQFKHIVRELTIMLGYGIAILMLAVWRYRKVA